ncbi:hypothetical protein BC827DRAFT_1214221 [Russula dissimulans]|nr:hypothetical protein BC827DRAFT_1214221 [Russula dissimulans]
MYCPLMYYAWRARGMADSDLRACDASPFPVPPPIYSRNCTVSVHSPHLNRYG